MGKTLDFNKVKKNFLTVTLPDDDLTTLFILTPTKAIMDEFKLLQDSITDESNSEAMDDMYKICAKIMSRNKANIVVTPGQLEQCLDVEDLTIFIQAYSNFLREITNQKN